MPERPKNPRHLVVKTLRQVNNFNRWAIGRYDQRQQTTDDGQLWRPLRDDEKVENNAEVWRELAKGCAAQARAYHLLEDYANRKAARLEWEAANLGHYLKAEEG